MDVSTKNNSHTLICGMSGSGKSYLTNQYFARICLHGGADSVVYFADFKQDDSFSYLRECPRYYPYDKTINALEEVYEIMHERQCGKDVSRHFVTLVWDEYMANILSLLGTEKKKAEGVMRKVSEILMIGRSLAVRIIVTCQRGDIVRTVIYMPVMIAPLIMGYIMYFLFQYDGGALNDIIMLLGHEPVDLLANSSAAIAIIVMVNSLQFVGVSMVIYLAGLQNVPNMYYEAAMLDGASSWQRFKHITFPLLMPAISSSTILNLIGGLKLFDLVMALTSGGPGFTTHSLSTLVTNQYFSAQSAGYASAIGIFAFLLIMVVSNVVMKFFDKREVDV